MSGPICSEISCRAPAVWYAFSVETGELDWWFCPRHTFNDNQDEWRLVHLKDAQAVVDLHRQVAEP